MNPLLGALTNNGGPTNTHALAANSPAVNAGDPANCQATDQRAVARPAGNCDIGAFEYVAPSTPGGPGGLPDPVFHRNVNALPKSGTVKVKLPGRRRFRVLREDEQIPLGTTVDTRRGRVTIVAAAGGDQQADFYDGLFKLSQTKGKNPITVVTLVEKLSCKPAKQANAAAKKKKKRRLWGNGTGRFRTKGKHSAATVVGHQVARPGPLQLDADARCARQGERPRLRQEEDQARAGGQEVRREEALVRRALLTLVAFGLLAAPAHATDYVVNTNVDPVSPDLVCTTARTAAHCATRWTTPGPATA